MSKANELFHSAQQHLIGGAVAGGRYHPLLRRPLYIAHGHGSRFWDVDGKEYIDFFTGSGATFLGHDHPALKAAIQESLKVGILCNAETEYHSRLAGMIADAVPCAEKVRLQNSGTEATMGAIRIARAYTGRPKILKFEGHFHGMHDFLWYNCSTDLGDLHEDGTVSPLSDSDGIPAALSDLVVVVPFNDAESFDKAIKAHKHELAAVILEPICYNMGCVPSDPEFLRHIRQVCTDTNTVLIFDEVLSGFRMCRGGAQEYYGITPDLCTLAKALGGGVPISAICGRKDIMSVLNPQGHTIISGTYTGSMPAIFCAIACQSEIAKSDLYDHINELANRLYGGIAQLLDVTHVPGIVQGIGARFGIFFGLDEPVTNYRQAIRYDREMERKFLLGCMERGLYMHDYGHKTPMHHGFSTQHSAADIDKTLSIMENAMRAIHT